MEHPSCHCVSSFSGTHGGYIDARDGALAIEKALRFDQPGFEAFIIASPDSVMEMPNDELLQAVFPDVQKRRPITDHETLWESTKQERSWVSTQNTHGETAPDNFVSF